MSEDTNKKLGALEIHISDLLLKFEKETGMSVTNLAVFSCMECDAKDMRYTITACVKRGTFYSIR